MLITLSVIIACKYKKKTVDINSVNNIITTPRGVCIVLLSNNPPCPKIIEIITNIVFLK